MSPRRARRARWGSAPARSASHPARQRVTTRSASRSPEAERRSAIGSPSRLLTADAEPEPEPPPGLSASFLRSTVPPDGTERRPPKSAGRQPSRIFTLRPMRTPAGITARLPTTVMPVLSRPAPAYLACRSRCPCPPSALGPTEHSLSRIARSTTAPARMTESNMTIESRTTAPGSTRTPGDSTERSTVPADQAAVGDQRAMDAGGRPDARRRALLGAGVDDPVVVVEVEPGVLLEQVHCVCQ